MSIKLKLEGFDELIAAIDQINGDSDKAVERVMRGSAVIMQRELADEMKRSNVDQGLISRMPKFEIENKFGEVTARVGYKKGAYNPDNISDGYKVVFLNYGTPKRSEHGKIVDQSEGGKIKLGFVSRAKNRAKPKIKKLQKEALYKIIERLKKR